VNGTALARAPGSWLADGILTHISRTPVDVARARHAAHAEALAASGWMIRQAPLRTARPRSSLKIRW